MKTLDKAAGVYLEFEKGGACQICTYLWRLVFVETDRKQRENIQRKPK